MENSRRGGSPGVFAPAPRFLSGAIGGRGRWCPPGTAKVAVVLRRRPERSGFSPVRVYSDPLQHAAIAAAVVAPLALGTPRRVLGTAVAAAVVIDLDHLIAARSARPRHTTALDQRPRTHSLIAAALAGALVGARAGPAHGWATFAALGSHLLHDAGDTAAPTPVLWPFRPAR